MSAVKLKKLRKTIWRDIWKEKNLTYDLCKSCQITLPLPVCPFVKFRIQQLRPSRWVMSKLFLNRSTAIVQGYHNQANVTCQAEVFKWSFFFVSSQWWCNSRVQYDAWPRRIEKKDPKNWEDELGNPSNHGGLEDHSRDSMPVSWNWAHKDGKILSNLPFIGCFRVWKGLILPN